MSARGEATILLLEDDAATARLEQLRLERAGYTVQIAGSAREGIERIMQGNIALVVLDQKLGAGSSGLECYAQIRAAGHNVPAILVTGTQGPSLLVEALRAGVRDFVPKTEHFLDHLEPTVSRVLDQVRTERELAESRIRAREQEKRRQELEREISERKRVERALRDAEERLRLMVESVKDFAIFTIDPEGRIVSWNPGAEQLFGYSESEILLQDIGIIFLPEDQAARIPEQEIARAAGEGRSTDERWHLRKDGSRFFASGVLAPIFDEENRLRGFTKIARDSTKVKQAVEERMRLLAELSAEREALKDADRRKDQFLAMLAHELRNPLAPISNAVQIMKLEGANGPNFLWSVQVIENQIKQMTRLVDDLLDVSRITRGKVVLQKELINLKDVVELACEASRPLFQEYAHRLTISLPSDPLLIKVDPARIAQVIANLLNNAAKYTDAGGEIALTAVAHPGEVEIRVKDNGIGISLDLLPSVFEMFAQADQTLSRSRGGLGIGLTLVRSLVEMHGGRISAASDGLGKGSEFVIHLPLPRTEPTAVAGDVDRQEQEITRRRILVVDDNRGNARSLGMLLRALGQEVYTAFDGTTALELARQHQPDLALLDIGLPGLDGYEVASRCRQDESLKQMVLVALTGYGKEDDRRRSRMAGFDAHLVKPVNFDDLRRLLGAGGQAAGTGP